MKNGNFDKNVKMKIEPYFSNKICPNCDENNWNLVVKLEYNESIGKYDIHLIQCMECMMIFTEENL